MIFARALTITERHDNTSAFDSMSFFILLSTLLFLAYFLSLSYAGTFGFLWLFLILAYTSILGIGFSLVLLMVSLFLQNALIAITTVYDLNNMFLFSVMQGTNFLITCLFSVHSYLMWIRHCRIFPPENRVLLRWI